MKRPRDINIVIGIGIFAVIAIAAYWITWFTAPQFIQARAPGAPDYEIYVNFEQAFPLADGYVAIAALIGAIGLWRMKSWGFLSMMLAAGGAFFLGLMDLLYDLEHSMFTPLNSESIIELIIVLLVLSLGPAMAALLWKQRKEFMQ